MRRTRSAEPVPCPAVECGLTRASFSKIRESKEDHYRMGFCSGIIVGLSYSGKSYGICFPAGATSQQAVNVIVQYIDGRPKRMNENFMSLSVEALRAAWPCAK